MASMRGGEGFIWSAVSKLTLRAIAPFKSKEGDDEEVNQTLFKNNNEGEGVLISPCSILRMSVETEATWTEIRFEFKSLSHRILD